MFLFQQDGIPESLRIKGEFLFVSASPSPPVTRRVFATCSIRVGLFFFFGSPFFPDRGQNMASAVGSAQPIA